MFVFDWIHWLQGTSPSSGACCRIFGPGILMKHWGFNIEYSQQYELILSGNRVYLAHFLWQFQWGKWWWWTFWINVHIETTQWFQTLLCFQTLRWFKLTLTFSGWVRNHKQNHHHHPALQRLPMDIFPRFSKHLWPLQSQQKADESGEPRLRLVSKHKRLRIGGLSPLLVPRCSPVDHLSTGTSERIVLRGVQKLGGCRLHQWCLRVRKYDTFWYMRPCSDSMYVTVIFCVQLVEFLDQKRAQGDFQWLSSLKSEVASRGVVNRNAFWIFLEDSWLKDRLTVAARLASLPMGDLHLVHALGLEAPPQRLLDRLSDRALDSTAPIFVPRWNRPPAPVVHGGNGAGHVNVVEANVGEANVGEANAGMAGDLQPPAAAPAVAPEGPAGDGVGSLVAAESSGVHGTKPDDPPAQPEDSAGAGLKQTEAKEGKNPGTSEKPWGPLLSWVLTIRKSCLQCSWGALSLVVFESPQQKF